jgi:hypothetical protein
MTLDDSGWNGALHIRLMRSAIFDFNFFSNRQKLRRFPLLPTVKAFLSVNERAREVFVSLFHSFSTASREMSRHVLASAGDKFDEFYDDVACEKVNYGPIKWASSGQ